jgi:1-acyl-sn-glycerol-3-phosphate acyltransferase
VVVDQPSHETSASSSRTGISVSERGMAGEPPTETAEPGFGLDRHFIARRSKGLFRFLSDHYWRIETKGLEHLPLHGPAVLVGAHRGFVPWDAIMAVHLILRKTERVPRFLVHPGLLKFSPIARFVTRMGGVLATRANAERVLENGELLGVFPEGVQGAFTPLRSAYRLQSFGRNTFASLASRSRAPVIPFVTVGSAEVYPIFATVNSRRWKRYAKWPCIPISTFPFFPLPLPVKWHMEFLPPLLVEEQSASDPAENHAFIKRVGSQVRLTMQRAIDEILQNRRSPFFGSVFPGD